ncbi:adenosine deaminase [Demequina zhanjiangensis]|uniref:adenosine deaminase n=1 Tax=Demequina zhanjiangensis TaxID=3051659 RepID=A0ABT8G106_9MICO|nr:adenosine deaminase [Demequina sp. SYSU T00b26]MDN4472825.1 adenosine deaminase [Demequina sp. SYSU T00b26]
MTLTPDEIRALPKVVLHDHLDGGVRVETLIELAGEIGYALPTVEPELLAKEFVANANSGSLEKYLEAFVHTAAVMQTAENLTRIAREAVVDHARDGVIYLELRYAPELHCEQGLIMQEVVDAVQAGIEEGVSEALEQGYTIRAAALLCAMRQTDRSLEVAELALANWGTGCVGFDIAGPEAGFPPAKHAPAFSLLRDELFPVTIHAGEADGLGSLGQALGLGAARRIGHGARITEDITDFGTEMPVFGHIAQYVLDQQIPLEMCPTSNVHTGTAPSIAEHPIHELRDLGFAVTINTDDKLMSGIDMVSEFQELVDAGWSKTDLFEATLAAAWGAFLPYDERADLADLIVEGYGMDE